MENTNNSGVELFLNGDMDTAETKFRQAIQEDNINASAYNNLAFLLLQKGNIDEAEYNIRESLKYNPTNSNALLNLGNILIKKGNESEGIQFIEAALRADASNTMALESLASVSLARQNYALADDCWGKLISLKPDIAEYWVQYAMTKMGLNETEAAISCLLQAIAIDDKSAFSWSQLGILEFLRRNYGFAEKALSNAVKLSPADEQSRYHLALVFLAKDEVGKAVAELDAILSVSPSNVKVLTERGILALSQNSHPEAEKYFQLALQCDPSYSRAAEYLLLIHDPATN